GLFAALFYTAFVQPIRQNRCNTALHTDRQKISPQQIKCLFRTMGTLMFYFVLLPEAVLALVLSDNVTATGTLVDRRVRTGAVSSDAVLSISGSFGCNLSHIVSCWELDEANMTRVSRGFYLPIRQHLQQAHLPESFSQMLMILVSFLVTHLIRGRGIWEVDHRLLLQQNELIRLNEQRLVEQRRSAGLVINAQNTDSRADGWRKNKHV
ncbi:hypothetical protein BOX15_Mlig011418g1, partial [Macrostomum lignano]